MKKRVKIMFFVILMILTLISTVFAQSNTEIVAFNGVYQHISYSSQGHYTYSYYRFFPNKSVSIYFSFAPEISSDVYKALELAPSVSSKYSVENGELKFSTISTKGTVDYTGTMLEDKLHLAFNSNITNKNGEFACDFIEVN